MCSFIALTIMLVMSLYIALAYANEAMMLLTFMLGMFGVISFLWLIFRRFTIKGRIEIPISVSEKDKENLIKIVVTNEIALSAFKLKAFIIVEDVFRGKKSKYWMKLSEAGQGETAFVQSMFFSDTGIYRITLKKLRMYDVTGLLYCNISAKSTECVEVMPKIHDVPVNLTLATKNFCGEADVYDEHKPGYDNSEIFQIRQYQKGDRIQYVHWKMTAKQDEIMVREHAFPKACPVIFLMDFKLKGKGWKKYKNVLPFMEAAISISYSMADAGCAHYVAWYDSDELDIKRMRIANEEDLFHFMSVLMRMKWEAPTFDMLQGYNEKYKQEPYVCVLLLDEELMLKKNDDNVAQLFKDELEVSLKKIELVL